LNQVGGILSLIFIILSVRRLLSAETVKRHFVHVPLLAATAFYAMPMIVFQQAKDMKLDPTLFAITVAAIFLLFEGIRRMESYGKDAWKLFAVSGFVAGIAFAVKFTTLMLFWERRPESFTRGSDLPVSTGFSPFSSEYSPNSAFGTC
jgi:4-amino-4-deoxy-L-arabinose transferase-like glycosyltransferase